jgi:PH and SEC7 domain-containing protein
VLKCLRLSSDPVSLELKRDSKVKDHVRKYLAANSSNHHNNHNNYQELSHSPAPSSPVISVNTNNLNYQRGHRISSSDSSAACRKTSRIPVNNSTRIPSLSAPQSPQAIKPRYQSHIPTANGSLPTVVPQKKQQHTPPRFEAYMMTGDLILNLSRTPQSSGILPATAQVKKSTVENLRDSPARSLKRKNGTAPRANYDTSPSESSSHSISELASYESAGDHHNLNHHHRNNYSGSNNSDNESRRASKLSKMHLAANSDSLDEEEEQLIMETTHDDDDYDENPSAGVKDERKTKKYNLSNIGCANNTSSSSSASSPTNTNSSNSSDNHHQHHQQQQQQQQQKCNNNSNSGSYDGGGVANKNNKQTDQVGGGGSSEYEQERNPKYSMLNNEDGGQGQSQQQQQTSHHLEVRNVTSSASMSSTTTTSSASTTINRSETLLTPTLDVSHSMPASPTSYSTPLLEVSGKRRELNSVPNSPECTSGNQQQEVLVVRRNSSNTHSKQNGVTTYRKCEGVGSFRTSRSEDHLQHSQREGTMGNAIPIDIDEDINSSLNTLLDTRHDSEDSQVSFFCANFLITHNYAASSFIISLCTRLKFP